MMSTDEMIRRYPKSSGLHWIASALFCLFLLNACIKEDKSPIQESEDKQLIPAPKITVLADLPDSLQPSVTYLDEMPKPITKTFPLPSPVRTFIDSVTGLSLPPELHGRSFFTNYTTEDGFATDAVFGSYMDRAGHLWFGTYSGGVSRYDGKDFTTFTTEHGLASNYVWEILEDKAGNMWFATFGGLSRYDGWTFTNLTTADGLPVNDIEAIIEDNAGNLWIASHGGGVSRYDGKSFTNFTEADGLTTKYVFCIEKDRAGKLWFGTRNGGILQYDATLLEGKGRFTVLPNDQDGKGATITCIREDNEGNILFGTYGMGLMKYDGRELTYYTTTHGLGANFIIDILEDRTGTLWIATEGGGLSRFDGKSFATFTTRHGLINNYITSLTEDDAGNIWFGTSGGGAVCYHGKAFTNFIEDPISDNVTRIIEDKRKNIWFGTSTMGIARYDGKSIVSFTSDQGLADNGSSFIMEDTKGRIWFSHDGPFVSCMVIDSIPELIVPEVSLTTFTPVQGLTSRRVNSIEEDTDGNIWFGTYGSGISRFDGESFTTFTTSQGLISNEIGNVFCDSKGNLWFTSLGSEGISYYNGESFMNLTSEQGLPDIAGGWVEEDKSGNLWFGSTAGLYVLSVESVSVIDNKEAIKAPLFQIFTTKDGLPDRSILHVVGEENGDVIVGTLSGVALLKGGLNAFHTPGAIEPYGIKNGYPLRDAFPLFKDSRNHIWIGSSSDRVGVARFDPTFLNKSKEPPVVVISKVKVNNENIGWHSLLSQDMQDSNTIPAYIIEESITFGRQRNELERDSMRERFADMDFDSIARWYPVPVNLTLPYRHNNLTIEFKSIVTTGNQMVRYQYMLEGYDKHWNPVTKNASATFGNIPEGQYTFRVKASSPEGVWSEPISYSFSVLPPLHRTWWAYTFYSLLLVVILSVTHKYQKQRTIKKEQLKASQKQAILNERLRISRELHDEVGATLSGISMYSHIAKEQNKFQDRQVVDNSLTIMQESAGEMVNKLNDIVWLLNPDQASLQKLMEKLEEYAHQMAQVKNMHVKSSMPSSISAVELPVEDRRNIYLILKEAINNSVKYSQATVLDLRVQDFDHTLEFVLQDNGSGFDTESIKKGNGLDNMRNRAADLRGSFSLDSNGQGTTLRLQYKIPQ